MCRRLKALFSLTAFQRNDAKYNMARSAAKLAELMQRQESGHAWTLGGKRSACNLFVDLPLIPRAISGPVTWHARALTGWLPHARLGHSSSISTCKTPCLHVGQAVKPAHGGLGRAVARRAHGLQPRDVRRPVQRGRAQQHMVACAPLRRLCSGRACPTAGCHARIY